jgi:uncharacterized protein
VQLPAPPRGFGTTEADVVVDAAGVLSAAGVARLNGLAYDLRAKSGGELAIVTLRDLRGRDIADLALRIGREWGVGSNARVGDRARNAGVVILVVPKETSSDGRGHVRVEVGQGAEGFIPDAVAGDIQREAIPYFQRGDYDSAVLLMATRVAERFANEFQFSLDSAVAPVLPPRQRGPGSTVGIPPGVLFLLFLLVFAVLTSAARRGAGGRRGGGRGGRGGDGCLTLLWLLQASQYSGRRRSGWGGGGFGGGSFGGGGGFGGFGGGGGFSGGGSSGSW